MYTSYNEEEIKKFIEAYYRKFENRTVQAEFIAVKTGEMLRGRNIYKPAVKINETFKMGDISKIGSEVLSEDDLAQKLNTLFENYNLAVNQVSLLGTTGKPDTTFREAIMQIDHLEAKRTK